MRVTTRSSFKNSLLKLVYLLTLFIGICQAADQENTVLVSITVAIVMTVVASIMVALICACLRTQCAYCQNFGSWQYHRIPSPAEFPINNPQGQYYGSNQLYPTQKNNVIESDIPPPAQIDHKEVSISLSSTIAPSTSPSGDASQTITQPSKVVFLPEVPGTGANTSLETAPLASEPSLSIKNHTLYDQRHEENVPPASIMSCTP